MDRTNTISLWRLIFLSTACLFVFRCEYLFEEEPATKSRLLATWEVTEVYDENGDSVTYDFDFPISAFHFNSDNSFISTGGPLTAYIVYGDNKYVEVASKIDQVFNYLDLSFNGGEYGIHAGVVDRFTIEFRMEGLGVPGLKSLIDLLSWLNIKSEYFNKVVYHKFYNVKICFEDDETMIWEFDDVTEASYNTKTVDLEYVIWGGFPIELFSRCKIVLAKRTKTIEQLIESKK
jgi:hypothetical protein